MEILSIILQFLIFVGLVYIISLLLLKKKDSPTKEIQIERNNEVGGAGTQIKNTIEMREEFLRINSFFLKILCEKKSKSNFKRLQKDFLDLGTRLYYLASENTIRKFLEFKSLSSFVEGTVHEHKIALLWFAEFNLLLRKDLGLETSPN